MSFTATSRNLRLEGLVLHAECRDWDGKYKSSQINLDNYIGNDDGSFSLTGHSASQSSSNHTLEGSILKAQLKDRKQYYHDDQLDLNLCIANMNGKLEYQKPNESLLNMGSAYMLSGSVLEGLCLGFDGRFHLSSIDLNDHYANDNGDLKSGDNHFYYSANNVYIKTSRSSVMLHARLKGNHWYSGDFWNDAEADLVTCIVIRYGRFIFEKHDGPFDREGFWTKFFEKAPVVGFFVAEIHHLAGNDEQAKRALAFCANSTVVCTGMVVGFLFGGPVGCMIGAGFATPLGIAIEVLISGTITDPNVKAQFEEATAGRFFYEIFRNMAAAGCAAYAGHFIGKMAGSVTAEMLGEISKMLGKAAGTITDVGSYAFLKKLADALIKGELPKEWLQTERDVKKLVDAKNGSNLLDDWLENGTRMKTSIDRAYKSF